MHPLSIQFVRRSREHRRGSPVEEVRDHSVRLLHTVEMYNGPKAFTITIMLHRLIPDISSRMEEIPPLF